MVTLITGWLDVEPDKLEAALVAGLPHVKATRAQKGCLDYNWSADPLTPGRIYVYERWETHEDLALHFKGPHYLAMRDTIGAHGMVASDVAKFRIDLMEPVYDPQGRPRADFFTEKT